MMIKDVSAKYNIPQDTLRYYERIGLIPPVNRNKSGMRDYTEKDCGWVEFIKCLRHAGFSIEVLIEYVRLFQQGDDETVAARKAIMVEQRRQLAERAEELQKTLERIDKKIAVFEDRILVKEKELK